MFSGLTGDSMGMTVEVEVDESALTAKKNSTETNTLVGAIDQGTSSTRFLVFTPMGEIAAWSQMEHTQIFPSGQDKVNDTHKRFLDSSVHFLQTVEIFPLGSSGGHSQHLHTVR